MEKKEILSQINGVFCEVFKNDSIVINETTTAKDIDEWDSLNHIMLISSIESHFKIKFSLNEILKFRNVGDTVDCIFQKLEGK